MLALKFSAILASTYMVAAVPTNSAPAASMVTDPAPAMPMATNPVPATTKCGLLSFGWKGPKGIECLSIGGALVNSSPPDGVKCPEHYYYRPEGYCTPRLPSNDKPDCDDKDFKWNEATFTCTTGTTSVPVSGN